MKSFREYHPIVIFIYFVAVVLTTMIQIHPLFLIISMIMSLMYCYHLGLFNMKKSKRLIVFYLIIALSNPLFVHEGATILFYINYTPITLEAIVYGFIFATIIISILNWFTLLNTCLDSEKIIYLFKKKLPTIALLISMVLGMVPKLIKQAKKVTEIQKTLGRDLSQGHIITRIKIGFDIVLILVTWGFESSLITLKSMQARGYGNQVRTHFHTYVFEFRDQIALLLIIACSFIFILGYIMRFSSFYYYPTMKTVNFDLLDILYYIEYLLLLGIPFLLERGESEYVNI